MITKWYNIITGEIVELEFSEILKGVPVELIPFNYITFGSIDFF